MMELYDLLIWKFEDYNIAPAAVFYTNGVDNLYPLPDGLTTFYDRNTGAPFVAQPFYKLRGVDLGVNTGPNGWVTMKKFTFNDRNKYFYPNTASTIYGVFNAQYRLMGDKIMFIPVPSGKQPIALWYIPRLPWLLQETDMTSVSISGWIEYVIVDAAIKALTKEESDTGPLMLQKAALLQRIEAAAANRDANEPEYIQDTRNNGPWGFQGPTSGGFGGGFALLPLPYLVSNHQANEHVRNAILSGQLNLSYTALSILFAYGSYLLYRKLCRPIALASVGGVDTKPSFFPRIFKVIFGRSEE